MLQSHRTIFLHSKFTVDQLWAQADRWVTEACRWEGLAARQSGPEQRRSLWCMRHCVTVADRLEDVAFMREQLTRYPVRLS